MLVIVLDYVTKTFLSRPTLSIDNNGHSATAIMSIMEQRDGQEGIAVNAHERCLRIERKSGGQLRGEASIMRRATRGGE